MLLRSQPIGHVFTNANHEQLHHGSAISKIIIDREYARGLEGLEDFSHMYVIFWLHEMSKRDRKLAVHPRGRLDIAKVGIFASRSPHRPNPIGLTLVKLVRRRGRTLTVKGLDAYNGTPILDLKPYDRRDSAPRPHVPLWWRKLERESKRKKHVRI